MEERQLADNGLGTMDASGMKTTWLDLVVGFIKGNHNNTAEMSKPHLRHTYVDCYEFIIFAYLLISVCGIIANTAELYFILKYRLHRDATYIYLINLSICDLIKCAFVIPFSVTMLLLQNWLFGPFLCYFIPMLQVGKEHTYNLGKWFRERYKNFDLVNEAYCGDLLLTNSPSTDRTMMSAELVLAGFMPPNREEMWADDDLKWQPIPFYLKPLSYDKDVPTHVTVLTLVMIVFDRHSFLKNPTGSRLPGFIFSCGTWLTAICVVLPYPIYTTYIDLTEVVKTDGVGICLFNLEKDIKEYNRAISIALFVIPTACIIYFFIQMVQIIEERSDETIVVSGYEIHLKGSLRRYYSRRFSSDRKRCRTNGGNTFLDNYSPIDPKEEEKRVQKFLIAICGAFGLCFGSFLILRNIHQLNEEDFNDTQHWDVMYALMEWIAYLPSVTTPILVLLMIIRSEDISDLRNYIRMKRKSIFHRVADDEDTSQMMSVTCVSRPSATTISTDFGVQQEKSI